MSIRRPNSTYKRTVHCRHCGQRGHNKASCSVLKNKIEKLRTEDPNNWHVQSYDAKKAKRARKGKDRTCSYCDNSGHNRATCKDLKEHLSITKGKNSIFRAAIYKRFQALGIGVGTIISSERHTQRIEPENYEGGTFRIPQVITQICWENINFWNQTYTWFDNDAPYCLKPLTKIDVAWVHEGGWPWDHALLKLVLDESSASQFKDGSHYRYSDRFTYFCEVESPVTTNAPPTDWLIGSGRAIKELYKKRKSWNGAL